MGCTKRRRWWISLVLLAGHGLVAADAAGAVFACTEPGIRDAIAAGGGPHTFDCAGPTTVTTAATIVIDDDVILDGGSALRVDGNASHQVFRLDDAAVTAELRNLTVSGGLGFGAAVWNVGTLRISNSTISGNTGTGFGGAIFNGIAGKLTLEHSIVSDNASTSDDPEGGGGLHNRGWAALIDSTVSGNVTAGGGGGIYTRGTLTLTNSSVSRNEARLLPGGGGIYAESVALTITSSTISENVALAGGGGIRIDSGAVTITDTTISDNLAWSFGGGGIENESATLTLANSTLSGNWAYEGGRGIDNASGTLVLTNTTLSGNNPFPGYRGGSVRQVSGKLTLTNCTVSETSSDDEGALFNLSGELTLAHTLIDADCAGIGSFESKGGNLESPGDTCGLADPTDRVNVTPVALQLGPLQDNGGPTETHALLPGSLAIDTIAPADCTWDDDREPATPEVPLETDQRGLARPQGAGCDTGAFERGPCIGGVDTDDDGLADACDNCPYTANPGQQDTGGIGAGSLPDGIGDACQCGDVSGDGRVTLSDAITIKRALLSPPTATMLRPGLCDVAGSAGCSVADAVVVSRAQLQPPTATVGQACAPANP